MPNARYVKQYFHIIAANDMSVLYAPQMYEFVTVAVYLVIVIYSLDQPGVY